MVTRTSLAFIKSMNWEKHWKSWSRDEQIQTVVSYCCGSEPLMLLYRCLGCSGPSPYTPCAQRGAANCSRTRPELSGLLPSCAAPAASLFWFFLNKKKDWFKQNV